MSARSARQGRGGRRDSAVAGTHFDSVRALLNRLSGYKPEAGAGSTTATTIGWTGRRDRRVVGLPNGTGVCARRAARQAAPDWPPTTRGEDLH